jgi:phosphatidylserine decarboxylase
MIAPEGWPFAVIPLSIGAVVWMVGWPVVGVLLIALGVFALFFFRNPERICGFGQGTACAPADGKVIKVCPAPAEMVRRGLPKQISIFMSVFNVHVNRAAIDGDLTEYSYNKGRKFSAFKEKASLENEQNLSVWDGPSGRIALKQIAGLVARRIVFDHSPGDRVLRGDRIGLIRYGSRVDVFLPDDATILVAEGDRVRAGESAIAELTGNTST